MAATAGRIASIKASPVHVDKLNMQISSTALEGMSRAEKRLEAAAKRLLAMLRG